MRPKYQTAIYVGALLAACTPNAQQKQALTVACQVDAVVQPIAVSALPIVAPGAAGASAAQVDALLVHPAVVAACSRLGGVPVAIAAPAVVTKGASK